MSVIPKIKIGRPDKRSKINLSFDCSTTANMGAVQPTMCREMVPNETFKVKVSSLIRLASMPRPTFGRISLRHYHTFVPYSSLWEPFTAMLSGQRFTDGSTTFIPQMVPGFTIKELRRTILKYSDITIVPTRELNAPVLIKGETTEELTESLAAAKAAFDDVFGATRYWFGASDASNSTNLWVNDTKGASMSADTPGVVNFGEFVFQRPNTNTYEFKFNDNVIGHENYAIYYSPGNTPITFEGADFISHVNGTDGTYSVLIKLKPYAKHLRSIFIGLGYQLNVFDNALDYSPLKVLAFYKSWFNLFSPIREKSFTDTNCYKVMKKMATYGTVSGNLVDTTLWTSFLEDLAKDTYYYLPMDYFSMAVTTPQQPNTDLAGTTISTPFYVNNGNVVSGSAMSNADGVEIMAQNGGYQSPLIQKIALRLLTFANKNTIVGRSIRDYVKTHYGVYEDESPDSLEVVRVGASRVNIDISDIMSTAPNASGFLGEYGGRGIGYRESEKFDFTAKEFGCWITLSVIVPESGYYQGYLQENRHRDRYHFFMPEFDAMGYQVLERGEVKADYDANGPAWTPSGLTSAFGLIPRYSEYKVGRNIINGDLSLGGLYNEMAPYTLDRRMPNGKYRNAIVPGTDRYGTIVTQPDFVPTVVFDGFRRIDPTDHFGQYSRIFNVTSQDVDHFIIHNVFDVDAVAPMKSLATSFDTESNDGDVMEVSHA